MTKIGIIGLGRMGGYHASICSQLAQVDLVGIADPHEPFLSKVSSPNLIKSKDYRDWIDQVDAVIIAVPTEFHYAIAKDCIQRNKHILLEKPLTKEIHESEELFMLAQAHKVALHVGHVERFNAAVQELKNIINEPFLIETHRMGPFAPRVQHDSVVLDLMIHDIDIVVNLINSPIKTIHALGNKTYTNSCDAAVLQLSFENGAIANIVSSRASQIKQRTMAIHQKNEYIHLDFTTQDISIHRHASSSVHVGSNQLKYKQETSIEHLFVHKDNPLKLEIEHFLHSITTGQQLVNQEQDLIALNITIEVEKALGLK